MERNPNLEAYRDRDDVEFVTDAHDLEPEKYEDARERIDSLDSHVAVGVNDESGDVLMVDDGHHGWTLPAFAFEAGDDWEVTGQSGVENILGVAVHVEHTERVRRVEFIVDDDPKVTIYNVVLRADTVSSGDIPEGLAESVENLEAVGWFGEIPADASESVADDARLFLD